ncbi:squalene-associated FAD-dependent desaturase [Variovorax sp. HW608]|uniref:hydroxysqualene dehydroxylase HpnE n=1 Tax=Variovorax sp. HW608 TaxID=1034889 RepID=UPI00081F7F1A|nr:hydroxysqualene dehydroxylase HpnE [Variovorax sp. HW608]SCK52954.1 squalene-associated FAD-dependent desaturase [Variovorax sp. HW608]
MNLAVVGGGWAGMACAVEAVRAGHAVSVFEAARNWGGRARAVAATLPDGREVLLDNGQHILIGAYTASLDLMARVGVDPREALQRVPLNLRFPDGTGLSLPRLAPWIDHATRRIAPLDVLAGVLGARGWSWQDKLSLLKTATRWQRQGFVCADHETVADLSAPLTPRVQAELTEPLCVSALNTPAAQASGKVFLRVLDEALFRTPGGSELLLPRVDLGALFPQAADRWLQGRGARTELGRRVRSIEPAGHGWQVDGEAFDRVVLACSPWEAARLSAGIAASWSATADALAHEAITTIYLHGDVRLPAPFLALRSAPRTPAQFAFDRGQLGGPRGLLAFVISASGDDRELLQQQVIAQAREQLGLDRLAPVLTVMERRATFACTPGLVRPPMQVAPRLLACGDYIEGAYPGTIEGAVRSAIVAAASL